MTCVYVLPVGLSSTPGTLFRNHFDCEGVIFFAWVPSVCMMEMFRVSKGDALARKVCLRRLPVAHLASHRHPPRLLKKREERIKISQNMNLTQWRTEANFEAKQENFQCSEAAFQGLNDFVIAWVARWSLACGPLRTRDASGQTLLSSLAVKPYTKEWWL